MRAVCPHALRHGGRPPRRSRVFVRAQARRRSSLGRPSRAGRRARLSLAAHHDRELSGSGPRDARPRPVGSCWTGKSSLSTPGAAPAFNCSGVGCTSLAPTTSLTPRARCPSRTSSSTFCKSAPRLALFAAPREKGAAFANRSASRHRSISRPLRRGGHSRRSAARSVSKASSPKSALSLSAGPGAVSRVARGSSESARPTSSCRRGPRATALEKNSAPSRWQATLTKSSSSVSGRQRARQSNHHAAPRAPSAARSADTDRRGGAPPGRR